MKRSKQQDPLLGLDQWPELPRTVPPIPGRFLHLSYELLLLLLHLHLRLPCLRLLLRRRLLLLFLTNHEKARNVEDSQMAPPIDLRMCFYEAKANVYTDG